MRLLFKNKGGTGLVGLLAGLLLFWAQPGLGWAETAALQRVPFDLPFTYVQKAELVRGSLFEHPAKTLLVQFSAPQTVLSSLEGLREGILAVGNHYTPPEAWNTTHCREFTQTRAEILTYLGLDGGSASLLFTGADMDNYAYAELESEGLKVGVLVTAGVKSNALRAGVDAGNYVEPGTINILALSNRKLADAAMAQALLLITEAKTAALEDLDVRSAFCRAPATGTGTDNVLVIQGEGAPATMSGGHTRLGELFARATRQAVMEAIAKQNSLTPGRDVRERLAERGIDLAALLAQSPYAPPLAEFEAVLAQPRYAGFLLLALPLADAHERGLLGDLSFFNDLCLDMAAEIGHGPAGKLEPVIADEHISPLLREALNALLTGMLLKLEGN